MQEILITGKDLDLEKFISVTRRCAKVKLSEESAGKIKKSRAIVEDLIDSGKVVYGLTTGFGSLSTVSISKDQTEQLQTNLIMSHAAGVGKPLSEEIVRGIILSRINTFANGLSGIRLSTVQVLVDMLNKRVYPRVPEKGSVGSSGDLAPISHVVLVMMGMGEAFVNGWKISGAEAMKHAEIMPIKLSSKEGLALNNGTSVMVSILVHTVYDSINLVKTAQISAAASYEGLIAVSKALDPRLHKARPHIGQGVCAANLLKLLEGSKLINSSDRVQDAYSLRCAPQVLGASIDTINYVKDKVEIELNSVTDNPLIFPDCVISGGNFHGQPMALCADFLSIALCEIGNISERRTARLVDSNFNNGLPAFLVKSSGLHSGFMIPQYTAAALVSENKSICHPASIDSIPTCSNQEDHVSMGNHGARKAKEILGNVEYVVGIELYCALQAIDLRTEQSGACIHRVKQYVRVKIPFYSEDRVCSVDMEELRNMVRDGSILQVVEEKIKLLQ